MGNALLCFMVPILPAVYARLLPFTAENYKPGKS